MADEPRPDLPMNFLLMGVTVWGKSLDAWRGIVESGDVNFWKQE